MGEFDFILVVLATAYLSHVVTSTAGPFNVFGLLRDRLPLGGLTTCIWCIAPYVCVIVLLLHMAGAWPVSWVFAVSGGAVLLREFVGVS